MEVAEIFQTTEPRREKVVHAHDRLKVVLTVMSYETSFHLTELKFYYKTDTRINILQ